MRYDELPKDALLLRDLLARDRTVLANERTLLAYIRTAIGMAAGGFALIKLSPGDLLVRWIGLIAIIAAVPLILIGVLRYVSLHKHLAKIGAGSM